MLTNNTNISGLVKVEEQPVQNHYHEGKMFSSVKVSSQRGADTSKIDYLRIYFSYELDQNYKNVFKPGNFIKYTGNIVKSKITESLSDIAVSLETAELVDQEELNKMIEKVGHVKSGSILNISGRVIKIGKEVVSKNIKSVSLLVMNEDDKGYRVIVKFTGVGEIAEKINGLNKDDQVKITAKVYSYKIKNRLDLDNYYLHDSRILSINKIEEKKGEVNE